MTQQPHTRSPDTGLSIAYRVMDDAVAFYMANGDAQKARDHIDRLANELKFYPDMHDAYMAALAKINEAEKHAKLEVEKLRQQQQRDLVMSLLGAFQPGMQAMENSSGNKAKAAESGVLPERLASEKAMKMWQRLQEAGYIGTDYQPQRLSRTEAALLADEMATRLGIRDKWKTFERLWNRNNMRTDFNTALDQRKTLDFRERLKSLFADIQ